MRESVIDKNKHGISATGGSLGGIFLEGSGMLWDIPAAGTSCRSDDIMLGVSYSDT